MKYRSTRDPLRREYDSAYVIKQGLAPGGGLFIPCEIPTLTPADLEKIAAMPYPERAATVLSLYLTDYTYEELLTDATAAYGENAFPGGTAPVVPAGASRYILELWHGPTAAFKDMALQIMPRLLSRALRKTGENKNALILVATSGDTGKAALEGYKDVERVKIMVFYPVDGVSRVQKLQMATQTGDNVNVCAIRGNFDDAQAGVKQIFADSSAAGELAEAGYILSSANSINWGRLVPQIVYYVSAYCDLYRQGHIRMGEEIDVCVPTGNFGNIFAAYLAKSMGLPIRRLLCASNCNNVLTDFLATGTYDRNRPFHLTMSPSMDILISSNLERLLSFIAGTEKTSMWMRELSETGKYTVDRETLQKIAETFAGGFADEASTARTIHTYWENLHYLADPHTAVGLCCADRYLASEKKPCPMLIDSTASPFKFAADVYGALTEKPVNDPLEATALLSAYTGVPVPYPLRNLDQRPIRFDRVIDAGNMKEELLSYIKKS